jgi:ribulose-phosphate 3-epimerase
MTRRAIAPSILSADFTRLGEELRAMEGAGADIVTFHVEATPHVHSAMMKIRAAGARVGLALTPSTPVEILGEVIGGLDMVLIMSVNPGFGGQDFIPESLGKIARLKRFIQEKTGRYIPIEVDGGVSDQNAAELFAAGADILVSGSFLYGAPEYKAALTSLRE